MTSVNMPQFVDLLNRALTEPGVISRAYTAFHGYSIGNQLLAFVQCAERGIPPGPIATFMGWKDKGRYVRKGEKAIVLCMPVTCKRKATDDRPTDGSDDGTAPTVTEPGDTHRKPQLPCRSTSSGPPLDKLKVARRAR